MYGNGSVVPCKVIALAADSGLVPDCVADVIPIFENGRLPILIVCPAVTDDATSIVTYRYPEPTATGCNTKDGNDIELAVAGAVIVDNNVAVPELNVELVEYQHFRFVISAVA